MAGALPGLMFFTVSVTLTAQTLGVAHWFDLAVGNFNSGGTITLGSLTASAEEF